MTRFVVVLSVSVDLAIFLACTTIILRAILNRSSRKSASPLH